MDWNKLVLIGGQSVVAIILGACVIAGHNSVITDALLAVSASIAGAGLITTVKVIKPKAPPAQPASKLESRGVLEESD